MPVIKQPEPVTELRYFLNTYRDAPFADDGYPTVSPCDLGIVIPEENEPVLCDGRLTCRACCHDTCKILWDSTHKEHRREYALANQPIFESEAKS